jgi:hypothetical protein
MGGMMRAFLDGFMNAVRFRCILHNWRNSGNYIGCRRCGKLIDQTPPSRSKADRVHGSPDIQVVTRPE